MPNFHSGTIDASAPTSVLISTVSTSAVAANNQRVGLVLTNVSDSTMYIGLAGNAAVLFAGISLNPRGGVWVMDEYSYNKEAVTAIAHTAGSILAIQEFITRS